MRSVLICPVDRPAVAGLLEDKPLALLSAFGKTFIEHWLEQLAIMGARHVTILAADRPEQIRDYVGEGARWGMRVEIVPEMRELRVDEARAKYAAGEGAWLPRPNDVFLADHLPGLEKFRPFGSYAAWYQALQGVLERRVFPNYIGLREIRPNVWAGRRARIADSAVVEAPCWIGAGAWIGEHARVGPGAIIEDRVFVDAHAEIASSVVASATYVGPGTELRNSLAFGSTLVNWMTNAVVAVPERFLLCGLVRPGLRHTTARLLTRASAFLVLALTLPFASCIALRSWLLGAPAFRLRKAVRPCTPTSFQATSRGILYYELLNTNRWWRRWPQLWNVFEGDFDWIGNRPLTAMQAGRLTTDFERLWLGTPAGLMSLGDAEGCIDTFDDEARAHSSFYTVRANARLKFSIMGRVIAAALTAPPTAGQEETFSMPVAEPAVKHQGHV